MSQSFDTIGTPSNPLKPVNCCHLDNPLNPVNTYNLSVPLGSLDGVGHQGEGLRCFVSQRT
jgi:hypothetical protein